LAKNVSACNFQYDPGISPPNALVQLSMTFTDSSGESVNLYHEVHLDNTP
jgi:hypothetical protein